MIRRAGRKVWSGVRAIGRGIARIFHAILKGIDEAVEAVLDW